jgi:hypothetical protein
VLEPKRQALVDAGAAHVIATDEQDLVGEILGTTGAKGARVVFDPVEGDIEPATGGPAAIEQPSSTVTRLQAQQEGQWGAYPIKPSESRSIAAAEAGLVKRK